MIKFLSINKGFIILCLLFSITNKFPILSIGMLISWVLFFVGVYYKEKATIEYLDSINDLEFKMYESIIKVFGRYTIKANRILIAIARMKIDEASAIQKLYQIRRISYKIMAEKDKNNEQSG